MTIERKWHASEVRGLCIRNNWYTCGTNDSYEAMLDMVRLSSKNPSDDMVIVIAENIAEHSDYERFCNRYGCDFNEFVDNIVFQLFDETISHHVVR